MALMTCPSCSAQTSGLDGLCSHCGHPVQPDLVPPIKKLSGKFAAIGIVIIAIAVIGTVLGTWWGPAALLPGVAFYMMARFL